MIKANNATIIEAPILDTDGAKVCTLSSMSFVEYEIPDFSTNRPPAVTVAAMEVVEEPPSLSVISDLKLSTEVPSKPHMYSTIAVGKKTLKKPVFKVPSALR